MHQFRDLQVNFGQTYGSCYVQLGHTVILASTEATVDEPRISRPSEGLFKVAINIGAGGKEKWLRHLERAQPKEAVLTMRLLEKVINRINVLDLESLCLVTGRFVWCICTKLVLLNFDGNLIEAASIATIASLMHFRRPEATVTPDGDIIIHSFEERNPLPLTLFHYPICVTFQFMDNTLLEKIMSEYQEIHPEMHQSRVRKAMQLMICDPTEEEEDFLKNVLVVCANTYREIVAIQSLGRLSLSSFSKQLLNNCSTRAFDRVKFVTDYLKKQLEDHKKSSGFIDRYCFDESMKNGDLCIVKNYKRNPIFGDGNSFTMPDSELDIGDGGASKWIYPEYNEEYDEDEEEEQTVEQTESNISEKSNLKVENYASRLVANTKNSTAPHKVTPISQNKMNLPEQPTIVPIQTNVNKNKNEWIKCDKRNKKSTAVSSTNKKQNKKKGNQKNQRNDDKKWKIPEVMLSSEEEEDNVTMLKSEYAK